MLLFFLLFRCMILPASAFPQDLALAPRDNVKQNTNVGQTKVRDVVTPQFSATQHVSQDSRLDHHAMAGESNDRIILPPHTQDKHRSHNDLPFQKFEVSRRHQDDMIQTVQVKSKQPLKSDTDLWNKDETHLSTDRGEQGHSVDIPKVRHEESSHSLYPPTGPARIKRSNPHLTNVALNKPAWMSTISFITTSPNNANDGAFNTDIRFCVHSLFETKDTLPYRFWRCDLKGLYQIFYVRVTNRGDCCGYRMQQISIDVARTMVDPMARNLVDDQLCVFHIPQICQGCTEQLDCTKPLIGRYVTITIPRIWIKGAFSTLNLCELQAFGRPVTEVAVGSECGTNPDKLELCEKDTVCAPREQTKRCSIPIGLSCNDPLKFHNCVPEGLCYEGLCRLRFGANCTNRAKWCRRFSVCEEYRCKLALAQNCSGNLSTMCDHLLICDSLHNCKVSRGVSCTDTSLCVSGAVCRNGRCECTSEATAGNSGQCVPKTGRVTSDCSGGTKCTDVNAKCIEGKCQCGNFTVQVTNYTCDVQPSCVSDDNCGYGNICENPGRPNAKCALGLGKQCLKEGRNCTKGMMCDPLSGVCMLARQADCSHDRSSCMIGAECVNNKTCRMLVDQPCSVDADCVSYAVCDSTAASKLCKVRLGSGCGYGQRIGCVTGSICEDNVCRLKLEQSCERDELCMHGTVCDTASNQCKLKPAQNCNVLKQDCMAGTICDVFHKCGVKSGTECQPGSASVCVSGAKCIPSEGGGSPTCQCNKTLTKDNGNGTCEPLENELGKKCSSSSTCVTNNAQCLNGTCACREGFTVDPVDLTCKVKPGSRCDERKGECVFGTTCSFGVCHLEAGQSCYGDYRGLCTTGTTCEKEECRLYLNQNCSGYRAGLCGMGSVCDALLKCRFPVGSECTSASVEYCVSGSKCEAEQCQCDPEMAAETTNKTCAPKPKKTGGSCNKTDGEAICDDPNAECIDGVCQCSKGYSSDTSFDCKKALGQACEPDNNECLKGTVCDEGLCKHDVDSSCTSSALCVSGTICDLSDTCKLKLGGKCNDERQGSCSAGTVCDLYGQCALSVDEDCNNESCVAGAQCVDNTCTCRPGVAKRDGLLCLPMDGMVGSDCNQVEGCVDPLARCVNDACQCKSSAVMVRTDLSCKALLDKSKSKVNTTSIGLGIVGAILLTVLLVGGFLVSRRFKEQADKRDALINELENRRGDLGQLMEKVNEVTEQQGQSPEVPEVDDEPQEEQEPEEDDEPQEEQEPEVDDEPQEEQEPEVDDEPQEEQEPKVDDEPQEEQSAVVAGGPQRGQAPPLEGGPQQGQPAVVED